MAAVETATTSMAATDTRSSAVHGAQQHTRSSSESGHPCRHNAPATISHHRRRSSCSLVDPQDLTVSAEPPSVPTEVLTGTVHVRLQDIEGGKSRTASSGTGGRRMPNSTTLPSTHNITPATPSSSLNVVTVGCSSSALHRNGIHADKLPDTTDSRYASHFPHSEGPMPLHHPGMRYESAAMQKVASVVGKSESLRKALISKDFTSRDIHPSDWYGVLQLLETPDLPVRQVAAGVLTSILLHASSVLDGDVFLDTAATAGVVHSLVKLLFCGDVKCLQYAVSCMNSLCSSASNVRMAVLDGEALEALAVLWTCQPSESQSVQNGPLHADGVVPVGPDGCLRGETVSASPVAALPMDEAPTYMSWSYPNRSQSFAKPSSSCGSGSGQDLKLAKAGYPTMMAIPESAKDEQLMQPWACHDTAAVCHGQADVVQDWAGWTINDRPVCEGSGEAQQAQQLGSPVSHLDVVRTDLSGRNDEHGLSRSPRSGPGDQHAPAACLVHYPACRRKVGVVLTNLFVWGALHKDLAAWPTAAQAVVEMLSDEDEECCARAAWAVSCVVTKESTRDALTAAGMLPPLCALLSSPHMDCKLQAALAFAHLAHSTERMKAAVIEAGVLNPLVMLLSDADTSCRALAAMVVANMLLELTNDRRQALADAGAVPALVAMLASSHEGCKEQALRAIGYLAMGVDSIGQEAVNAGVMPLLISLLRAPSKDSRSRAASALGYIVEGSVERQDLLVAGGALDLLVGLLKDGDVEERSEALATLSKLLAREGIVSMMVQAGVVPLLVGVMGMADPTQQESCEKIGGDCWGAHGEACQMHHRLCLSRLGLCKAHAVWMLIQVLDGCLEARNVALQSDAVTHLVRLLLSESPSTRHSVIRALVQLVGDSLELLQEVALEVLTSGAVNPLYHMLSGQEEDSVLLAVGMVSSLMRASKAFTKAMLDMGALDPLAALLCHARASVVYCAAIAFVLVTSSRECESCDLVVRAGAIEPLVDLLGDESLGTQSLALRVLDNLAASSPQRCAQIAAAPNALSSLGTLLLHNDEPVQRFTLSVLHQLARGSLERSLMMLKAGVLGPMVELLFSASPDVHYAAVWTLEQMTCTRSSRLCAQVIDEGALPALVLMLNSWESEIQLVAASTLSHLAFLSSRRSNAIVSAGAMGPLVSLLNSMDEGCKHAAARAIAFITFRSRRRGEALMTEAGNDAALALLGKPSGC